MLSLKNKIFVLTGSFPGYKKRWKDLIERNGGIIKNDISKNTDYLLIGYDPGKKYKKALELNIKIIDIDNLEEMIK